MKRFDSILIVSHVAYRKTPPIIPIEGPYSSVGNTLQKLGYSVDFLGLPLNTADTAVMYGEWGKTKTFEVNPLLHKFNFVKYGVDILITFFMLKKWELSNLGKRKLVIGIDPLSMLPLWLNKKIFGGYKLIFHCVDFNKTRFGNIIMQRFYEKADEWASKFSDQTWVICQSLKDYKKKYYGVKAIYVPNSVKFDPNIFEKGKSKKTGDKMIWTGGLFTDKQFEVLFETLKYIQTRIRPEMKFVFAPTRDHAKFKEYVGKYKLKKATVLNLTSRAEFQTVAAKCDAGIALYDEEFGSTEFIEPMKIWDFMLCGLPFIVSAEPSISKPVVESGVAYFMKPHNEIPDKASLKKFLGVRNLKRLSTRCLRIAEKFDFEKQIARQLVKR